MCYVGRVASDLGVGATRCFLEPHTAATLYCIKGNNNDASTEALGCLKPKRTLLKRLKASSCVFFRCQVAVQSDSCSQIWLQMAQRQANVVTLLIKNNFVLHVLFNLDL
ncbi:hypothetical protein CCR75_001661 [Bremia lactucae]|uniref:Uncharacterized protein n=1 Tax=Bremia lactucae TaxID=4779 RepID=A0A976IFN8_BRELC|nr:hypothetical protein CCR75_001661 [Bremia lactucae]